MSVSGSESDGGGGCEIVFDEVVAGLGSGVGVAAGTPAGAREAATEMMVAPCAGANRPCMCRRLVQSAYNAASCPAPASPLDTISQNGFAGLQGRQSASAPETICWKPCSRCADVEVGPAVHAVFRRVQSIATLHQLPLLCSTGQGLGSASIRPTHACRAGPALTSLAAWCTRQATQKRDGGHAGMRRLVAGLVGQLSSLTVAAPPAQVVRPTGASPAQSPCVFAGCASNAIDWSGYQSIQQLQCSHNCHLQLPSQVAGGAAGSTHGGDNSAAAAMPRTALLSQLAGGLPRGPEGTPPPAQVSCTMLRFEHPGIMQLLPSSLGVRAAV